MVRIIIKLIIALAVAFNAHPALADSRAQSQSTILLAQNMSTHHYHRGLRDLNKQMAIIKEQLRQQRKETKRLQYELSKQQPGKSAAPHADERLEQISKDRDTLLEKVAALESSSIGVRHRNTRFSLFGTVAAYKLSASGKASGGSYSRIQPLILGIDHKLQPHTYLNLRFIAGKEGGSQDLAIETANLRFIRHGGFSIVAGRFLLPLTRLSHSYGRPNAQYTVSASLFDTALAPFGLTGDGVGLRYGSSSEPSLDFATSSKPGISWEVYLHNGLAANLLSGASGLADLSVHRGESRRSFEKLGVTARVNYQSETTFTAGVSAVYSGLAKSTESFGLSESPAGAVLSGVVADAKVKIVGINVAAGVAHYSIADSEQINETYGRSLGSTMSGFYAQAAFDVLSLGFETDQKLMAFVRHDNVNSQQSTKGFHANPANYKKQTTFGLGYDVAKNVTVKLDNVILSDDSKATDDANLTRLGMSFAF